MATRSPWQYLRPHQWQFYWGTALLFATNAIFLGIPVELGRMVDALRAGDAAQAVHHCLWLSAYAVATALTRIGSRLRIFNAARAAEYDLRGELFGHLLTMEPAYFRGGTGNAMTALTSDMQTVRALWGAGILNVANTVFAFGTVLIMMVRIDPLLTLLSIVPYPAIIIVGRAFGKHIFRASQATQQRLSELSNALQEDFGGIAVLRAYGAEPYRRRAVVNSSSHLLGANMGLVKVRGYLAPTLAALGSMGTLAVLWYGGNQAIAGKLDVGDLVEFSALLVRLVWPTVALGWMLSLWQRGMASWQRVEQVLSRRSKTAAALDATSHAPTTTAPQAPAAAAPANAVLDIRHLSITIGGHTILEDVSLTARRGEVIAIVGATGAGKSTLCDAICGLIEIPAGAVYVMGDDMATPSAVARRHDIDYAQQDAFLFSTTVGDNIAFGLGRGSALAGHSLQEIDRLDANTAAMAQSAVDDPLDRAAIESACIAAGLTTDLAAMPQGLHTVVGERGITLSGGQRQRTALARALIRKPTILLLDDSLSSVDAKTEAAILEALDTWLLGTTTILISHRPNVIRRAARVYVLEAGRIAEMGPPEALLAQGGIFASLYGTDKLAHEVTQGVTP